MMDSNGKYGFRVFVFLGALGINLVLYAALSLISNREFRAPDVLYDRAVALSPPPEILPEPEPVVPERKSSQTMEKNIKKKLPDIGSFDRPKTRRPEMAFKKPEFTLRLSPKIDTGTRVPDLPSSDFEPSGFEPSGQADVSAITIFNLGEVDQRPNVLRKVNPVYPYSAKRRKIEGNILIEFVVDADGFVQSAKILRSEPEGVFDESGLKAVRRWRFRPGYVNGRPVATRFQLPLVFELED